MKKDSINLFPTRRSTFHISNSSFAAQWYSSGMPCCTMYFMDELENPQPMDIPCYQFAAAFFNTIHQMIIDKMITRFTKQTTRKNKPVPTLGNNIKAVLARVWQS